MTRNRSSPFNRVFWRAASKIQARLKTPDTWPASLVEVSNAWREWGRTRRRIELARQHRLLIALRSVQQEASTALAFLSQRIDAGAVALRAAERVAFTQPVQDIYRDILALHDEFTAVDCSLRDSTLSAVTDSIELEGVYLGPFEIRLDWHRAAGGLDFSVVARDPQPSAKSDVVTHPHVENGELCAGEGRVAIRQALEQGRLLDFFLIVRQILETYNSSSAYVELRVWHGASCPDCGADACDDDFTFCDDCDTGVCTDCMRSCNACDYLACGDCLSNCSACEEPTCRPCFRVCSRCQSTICKDCLDDDTKLCGGCREEDENEEALPAALEQAARTGTEVHTVRVGQAAVPA